MNTSSQPRIPITPGMMRSLRCASDVNLSPDARRVAFEVQDWASGQRKRRSTIWVVETSDGEIWEQKPLSRGEDIELAGAVFVMPLQSSQFCIPSRLPLS